VTRQGDLVLDPFCGSGTTLREAKKLRRDFLGIEKNERYVTVLIEHELPLFVGSGA